jgi:hypothetical protein
MFKHIGKSYELKLCVRTVNRFTLQQELDPGLGKARTRGIAIQMSILLEL